MLKNIALIASFISAVTAVTTSLRALGKSRENLRDEIVSKIKTGSRTGNLKTLHPSSEKDSLLIYLIVTAIWFILSVIFSLPLYVGRWENGIDVRFFLWTLPFVALIIVLCLIWRKVMHPDNKF